MCFYGWFFDEHFFRAQKNEQLNKNSIFYKFN